MDILDRREGPGRLGAPRSLRPPCSARTVTTISELNLVISGRLDYLFGGNHLSISAGQIAIFWAATPHRLIETRQAEESDNCWVHIPLTTVMSWGLPANDLSDLLGNGPIVLPNAAAGRDVTSMFESWMMDLRDADRAPFALLEAQALVRRLLHRDQRFPREDVSPISPDRSDAAMRHVVQMAQFAVTHFREPISPADIARQTHLNPTYAMTLFRENVGTTVGSYLTRCRIAEAQRLLVTTTTTAAEAGRTLQGSGLRAASTRTSRERAAYRRVPTGSGCADRSRRRDGEVGAVRLVVDQQEWHKTDVEVAPSPVCAGVPPVVPALVIRDQETARVGRIAAEHPRFIGEPYEHVGPPAKVTTPASLGTAHRPEVDRERELARMLRRRPPG